MTPEVKTDIRTGGEESMKKAMEAALVASLEEGTQGSLEGGYASQDGEFGWNGEVVKDAATEKYQEQAGWITVCRRR